MRFLIAWTFFVLAVINSFGQDSPLVELTVTSTRLKCLSGFTEISYGYKRGASNDAETRLEFVVIETDEYNSRFRVDFHLNSKVDDVTPPACLAMEKNTVDLPNDIKCMKSHTQKEDIGKPTQMLRWLRSVLGLTSPT